MNNVNIYSVYIRYNIFSYMVEIKINEPNDINANSK